MLSPLSLLQVVLSLKVYLLHLKPLAESLIVLVNNVLDHVAWGFVLPSVHATLFLYVFPKHFVHEFIILILLILIVLPAVSICPLKLPQSATLLSRFL